MRRIGKPASAVVRGDDDDGEARDRAVVDEEGRGMTPSQDARGGRIGRRARALLGLLSAVAVITLGTVPASATNIERDHFADEPYHFVDWSCGYPMAGRHYVRKTGRPRCIGRKSKVHGNITRAMGRGH